MRATIQKWGNSNAVRIPKTALAAANMKEHDNVWIITKQDEIIIFPVLLEPVAA
jgi:antitoxin MazE